MKKTYSYKVRGVAADGQTWAVDGEVETLTGGELMFERIMRSTFMKLTAGKAVFGKPGVGCRGPYSITHFQFDLVGDQSGPSQ